MAWQTGRRVLWIALGYVALGLGIVGLVLPVMPGVVFLLIAAFCFSRGSDRLHRALLAHPRLGPPIVAWREYGVIPTRVKILAVSVMASSVVLTWWMEVPPVALWTHMTILTIVAIYLVTRPSRITATARPVTNSAPSGGDSVDPTAPLPPNQQLTARDKWPVVGEKAPRSTDAPWSVQIDGLVESPRRFTLAELRSFGVREFTIDIHCVTRWSRPNARFSGVPLGDVLAACAPLPSAAFVSFLARSDRDHSTSLPLEDALRLGAIIAFEHDGEPLETIHGGPVRVVVPGRYFYKSVKWLERIECLAEDRLGFWEAESGYHNVADPWLEQRYAVLDHDRREVARLFAGKDFSDRELRSLQADRQPFAGLVARGAKLRDASFRGADLQGACFDGANLSNAHLEGANLRGASFRPYEGEPADLEGADFRGADLRGAVFEGASLFGSTFCTTVDGDDAARLDATTAIDAATLATLEATPVQLEFVRRSIESSLV